MIYWTRSRARRRRAGLGEGAVTGRPTLKHPRDGGVPRGWPCLGGGTVPAETDRDQCRGASATSALSLWRRTLTIMYLRFGFSVSVLMAAGIAFFSLMCLAPLGILLAAALRSVFGAGGAAYMRISQAIEVLGPETAARIMPQLDDILADPGSHLTSVLSVIALIWAGMRLFEIVERALTDVWPGKFLRGYLHRKVVALTMMVIAGLLLSSFVLFAAFLASARAWLAQFGIASPALLDTFRPRFLGVYQFVLAFAAFALLYRFMPRRRPPVRASLAGAACAAVLWQIASVALTQIIRHSAGHGSFYGGLTGIVVFSLWCFLGAEMLLLGAHFAVAWEHVFISRRGADEDDELIEWPERPDVLGDGPSGARR